MNIPEGGYTKSNKTAALNNQSRCFFAFILLHIFFNGLGEAF